MLGLGDKAYALIKSFKAFSRDLKIDWEPELSKYDDTKSSWFCFVPRNVSNVPFMRKGLIPKKGTVFVYKIYSLDLIKPDPLDTVAGLERIYSDAFARMNESLQSSHSLNILGVSLGNVIAIRAAGNIGSKVDNLVSIVGGGRLGLSAWDSILTGSIARKSGCSSPAEYEKLLSKFSPINYIDGVMASNIIARLGTHDLLIPFKHGQELVSHFRNRSREYGSRLDYQEYLGADHSAALFISALSGLEKRTN